MILDKTCVLKIESPDINDRDIEKLEFAASVLKKGGLVAFPTETVYGLGANCLDTTAVENIFKAKGRPQDNPLIVHLSKTEDIDKFCFTDVEFAQELISLMPAPLTVIFPKKDIIPDIVTAGHDNVGIRIPNNKIARKFIEICGVPVSAPSANLSGKPSPTTAEHVFDDLDGKVDVIIDGGICSVGLESTVVTLCTKPPMLLRPGGISYEQLVSIMGEVDISSAVLDQLDINEKAYAPGMKHKHYSPEKAVFLLEGSEANILNFAREKAEDEACAFICYTEDVPVINSENCFVVGSKNEADSYAKNLFDTLRKADKDEKTKQIFARLPANHNGISLAVCNRLFRAAGFCFIDTDKQYCSKTIVGLTGPTGAGKGMFCKYASETGIKVIDTDKIARDIMERGTKAYCEVVEFFGKDILCPDGSINRKKLGTIVFSDNEKLQALNSISHKYISEEAVKQINQANEDIIVIDAPVLFESQLKSLCHITLGILSDEKMRKERIVKRDKITDGDAELRMRAARDESFFVKSCDFVIYNNSSLENLKEEALKFFNNISPKKRKGDSVEE